MLTIGLNIMYLNVIPELNELALHIFHDLVVFGCIFYYYLLIVVPDILHCHC